MRASPPPSAPTASRPSRAAATCPRRLEWSARRSGPALVGPDRVRAAPRLGAGSGTLGPSSWWRAVAPLNMRILAWRRLRQRGFLDDGGVVHQCGRAPSDSGLLASRASNDLSRMTGRPGVSGSGPSRRAEVALDPGGVALGPGMGTRWGVRDGNDRRDSAVARVWSRRTREQSDDTSRPSSAAGVSGSV